MLADHSTSSRPISPFGFSKVSGDEYRYTFAQLTQTMQAFVDALQLERFGLYVFDYGAPIGFNVAVAAPKRITGIISQNGNVYEAGLGDEPWAPLSKAVKDAVVPPKK